MRLLPDWKDILVEAWSIRLIVIAGLLTSLEAVLPYFEIYLPTAVYSVVTLLVISGAFVARILAQGDDDEIVKDSRKKARQEAWTPLGCRGCDHSYRNYLRRRPRGA